MSETSKISSSHYVNNENLLKALIEYKKLKKENPDAKIPEYIGVCIMEIAKRFSRSPNFVNYSFRDEMIGDAIENCLLYLDNFDPEKSKNPFAYFTQICYNAFARRIIAEKKQSYIKHKLVQDNFLDSFDINELDDKEMSQNHIAFIQAHNEFDDSYFTNKINKKALKKEKKKKTNLEFLMQEIEG